MYKIIFNNESGTLRPLLKDCDDDNSIQETQNSSNLDIQTNFSDPNPVQINANQPEIGIIKIEDHNGNASTNTISIQYKKLLDVLENVMYYIIFFWLIISCFLLPIYFVLISGVDMVIYSYLLSFYVLLFLLLVIYEWDTKDSSYKKFRMIFYLSLLTSIIISEFMAYTLEIGPVWIIKRYISK